MLPISSISTISPPFLHQGDTIGIVCPSGFMPKEKTDACIKQLIDWGYKVKIGKTVGNQNNYFSGTDAERLADIQQMLDDKEVKAILCARGGYGLSRIIDAIDFTQFLKTPKWIIGYSDFTVLLAHLYQQFGIAGLHAPMAAAFELEKMDNTSIDSIKKIIEGEKLAYKVPFHPLNRVGVAKGKLVGGNLTIINHLIGTNSCYDTVGKILFLEDIGEYLYNIDRLFVQLDRAGMLANISGLILGGFTDLKDTIIPFGKNVHEIISFHIQKYQYPVCFDFPIGHQPNNCPVKIGADYELIITSQSTILKEV